MKSSAQIALDKTAPNVVAPAPKVPANATPDALQAEAERIRTNADAKLAEIRQQLNQVNSVRAPLGHLLQKREALLVLIRHAERQLEVQLERAGAFRLQLHEAFRCSENGSVSMLWQQWDRDPALPPAERLARELELWIADRRAEVPALSKACRDYAAEHRLSNLLPAELQ